MVFFYNTTMGTCLPRKSKQLGLKTVRYVHAVHLPDDPPCPTPSVPPNLLWEPEPTSELSSPNTCSLQM